MSAEQEYTQAPGPEAPASKVSCSATAMPSGAAAAVAAPAFESLEANIPAAPAPAAAPVAPAAAPASAVEPVATAFADGAVTEPAATAVATAVPAAEAAAVASAAAEATASASVAATARPPFVAPLPNPAAPPKKGGAAYLACKRLFDIVFSLAVCVLLAIPVALICLAIVIDSPGKPFFRQERVGQYGRKIRIIKLRTMVPDAHTHPERYMTPEQLAVWRREQKVDDDPRLTRMGKWLRSTSLDELPQFLNVLVGELSVIGPRPVTEAETHEFGSARDEFLSCKPGITGWWQVISRNDSNWENGTRQLIELFYVRHQSFSLDARIFARTFHAMRKGK